MGAVVRSSEIRMRRLWCLDASGGRVGGEVGGHGPGPQRGGWESLRGREGRGREGRGDAELHCGCVRLHVCLPHPSGGTLVKRWLGVSSKTGKSELGVVSHRCEGSRLCSWTFPVLELVKVHPPTHRPASRRLSPGVLVPAGCWEGSRLTGPVCAR